MRPIARTAILLALAVALAACGASARETTIRATLTSLDAAQVGFLAYDQQHQAYIVAHAADEATGAAQLADYRHKREPVEKAFIAGYQAVATAALVNDDHSLAGLLAAAVQVKEALAQLGVTP